MIDKAPIVVGVDGSSGSFDAVRWAARTAVLHSAPLTLVSAYQDNNIYTTLAAISADGFAELAAATDTMLRASSAIASEAVHGAALMTTTESVIGAAIPILLEHSSTARMVVVGSRGNGQYFAELLGSVSAAVAERARCPVAVIHRSPDSDFTAGSIVVGVDGSKANQCAIGVAFEEASLRGAGLVAVHAWADNVALRLFHEDDYAPVSASALDAAEQTVLAEGLAGWQEQYPEVVVKRVVVRDDAVNAIVELSKGAQAVVVGSRGRGGFSGLLQGSTSRSLSHLVECPLIVVRGTPE